MDTSSNEDSFAPSFWRLLKKPEVQNILVTGCGGGFDFVHGMILYPELLRLKKNVTIGSFSFGSPLNISQAETVMEHKGEALAKKVTQASEGASRYCPEVRLVKFLDEKFPAQSPHLVYAYNARKFSVPLLTKLYEQFISTHNIDTIIVIDGGTDSLMKGDEAGLGDPIEDCISVTVAANLKKVSKVKNSLLLTVGFGMDRFNDVSDAESMRAVAEITTLGGFLGSISIEASSKGFQFYKECIEFINAGQSFRSVMSQGIIAAVEGGFGYQIPQGAESRVAEGGLYLWPLMAMIWAFDPLVVAERSLTSKWIASCESAPECHFALDQHRSELYKNKEIRAIQSLPRHDEILQRRFGEVQNSAQQTPQEEEEEREQCRLM